MITYYHVVPTVTYVSKYLLHHHFDLESAEGGIKGDFVPIVILTLSAVEGEGSRCWEVKYTVPLSEGGV
jgi:hypothetical protein